VREGNRGEAQGVNSPSEQFQGNWLHVQKHWKWLTAHLPLYTWEILI
jgi:hypothetical protein